MTATGEAQQIEVVLLVIMNKVIIVGAPGTGKSTLARKLTKKTGLPIIHLDYYYHQKDKDYYHEKNKPAWFQEVKKLVKQSSWIMDGNYSSTYEVRFKAADIVIFLDFPRYIYFARVLKRAYIFRSKHRPEMPSDWKEKLSKDFLSFVWNFNKNNRRKITNSLDKISDSKIYSFKSPRELNKFLKSL